MARVLVTGGAGFIGSHLAEALAENHEVVVIDNLSAGDQNVLLLKEKGIRFIKGDISNWDDIDTAIKGCDVVFHLAAMNRAMRSVQDPLIANKWNVDGTLNVLEACRRNGVKKIIFASSSSVYAGNQDKIKNEDGKIVPLHPYAVGKAAGEMYTRVYGELFGIKYVILRYFSVYGPRQRGDIDYAAVIPKFIKAALAGKALTVFGDGKQVRNFTYVKDAVSATIAAYEAASAEGETINIASHKEYSILDIVDAVKAAVKTSADVVYQNRPLGDPDTNTADIKKLTGIVKFRPVFDLKTGIKETVEWFSG